MVAQKLPYAETRALLEEGLGPTEIARRLNRRHHIDVTPAAVSIFRKRHTDIAPRNVSTQKVPWRVRQEHKGSRYRVAILAWHQREQDHELAEDRWRNLAIVEAELMEAGRVIDYSPDRGFFTRPARDCDQGIVREPDGVPRPPTRGPYADPAARP